MREPIAGAPIRLAHLFDCDHCGRTAGDFDGGASSMSSGDASYRFCHPNVRDRPDCYRLVTVYGEQIGSRKPGGLNSDQPDWSRGNPYADHAPAARD